tara:strand:+ start:2897 stop:3130 length:234 start_codon:yes stop_codon:yes gene_type:complete
MKLNMENNELGIVASSISTYIKKLDNELSELSTYRTELDNPVIVHAVALEQKRISMIKDDSSKLLNRVRNKCGAINV